MEAEIAVLLYALRSLPWFVYAFLVISLGAFAIAVFDEKRRKKKEKEKEKKKDLGNGSGDSGLTPREVIDYPVIGYKTANIESISIDANGDITDIVFRGLVGKTYSVTDKSIRVGAQKFNSYMKMEKALNHAQNWGSTLLEVIGYGEVEEHKHGYTSQKQRVLQVAFMECSHHYREEIKCDNEPVFLGIPEGGKDKSYRTYCAGCVGKVSDATPLAPHLNRSYVLKNGETLVVAAESTREHAAIVPTVLPSTNGGEDYGDI